MKYFIELGVRAQGLQLLQLTEDEKEQLLKEENLDEVYYDFVEEREYCFTLEGYYLTTEVDRYSLVIRDENGNIVYDSEDVDDLLSNDKTFDEDDEVQVKGWKFKGIENEDYLVRYQTIKGAGAQGEFELEEPFDKNKLYVVRDEYVDDDLMGDNVYPLITLYYQQGEGYDCVRDVIKLDYEGDNGEQYWDTYIYTKK